MLKHAQGPAREGLMDHAYIAHVNNKVGFRRETQVVPLPCFDCVSGLNSGICTVNEATRPIFLDLKEGALVISLGPYVGHVTGGGWVVLSPM